MAPIRIGVIGASPERGWARTNHLPALQALPEYDVVAVCTSKQESAERAAEMYGAQLAFWDYHELLKSPDIDAVTIAVRVPWHHEMALAALAAGKHVYCEWPLAQTIQQGEEMAAAAAASGLKTQMGLQGRFAPWLRYVKEMVEDGTLGRVYDVNARLCIGHGYIRPGMAWAANRDAGNHMLWIHLPHHLDFIRHAFGEFEEVAARVDTQFHTWDLPGEPEPVRSNAPDSVAIHGAFRGGTTFSGHFAYIPGRPTGWRMEIFGEKGTVVASASNGGHSPVNRLEGAFGGEKDFHEMPIPEEFRLVPADVPSNGALNIAHVYRQFAESIQNDTGPHPDFQDGLDMLRLLETLSESSRDGRTIRL
jgi:predicted dehydrogenase